MLALIKEKQRKNKTKQNGENEWEIFSLLFILNTTV